jgi:hypothetical protein
MGALTDDRRPLLRGPLIKGGGGGGNFRGGFHLGVGGRGVVGWGAGGRVAVGGLSAGLQPPFIMMGQKERLHAESGHDGERAVVWHHVFGLASSLGPFGRV